MTTTLQNAAAEGNAVVTNPGAIDPNTGRPETAYSPPLPSPRIEQESFVDEWAKAPDQMPPVRTWIDPAARARDGEYLAAWDDAPVTPAQAAGAAPGVFTQVVPPAPAPAAAVPTPTPTQAAVTPAVAPTPRDFSYYFENDGQNPGPGNGAGGPGDGGGGASGDGGTGGAGAGGNAGSDGSAGDGTGDGGPGGVGAW